MERDHFMGKHKSHDTGGSCLELNVREFCKPPHKNDSKVSKHTVDELILKLQAIANTDLENQVNVQNQAMELERLVLSQSLSPQQENDLVQSLDSTRILEKLRDLYQTFEVNLENRFANALLNGEDYQSYALYKRFTHLVEHDIKLAQVHSGDTVAFIGVAHFL